MITLGKLQSKSCKNQIEASPSIRFLHRLFSISRPNSFNLRPTIISLLYHVKIGQQ